jgi:hypothetical protein
LVSSNSLQLRGTSPPDTPASASLFSLNLDFQARIERNYIR